MASSNGRIAWIDTARGLGLLAVFIGHLNVPYASAWVYTFHMPLFFFLSGLLYPGCEKYSITQFAWRRFKGLVIPYFTLGAIIALFYCCVYALHHEPIETYLEMCRSFLIQEHYWTIYYFLDWCFRRWKYAVSIASAVVCFFGLVRYRMGWGCLPWNLDIAFVAQLFFHLGYRFMDMEKVREWFVGKMPLKRLAGILMLCMLINIVAAKLCIMLSGQSLDMSIGMYGNEFLTFVAAIAGILLIVTIGPMVDSKLITYLGRNTMILFSWHSRIVIVACSMLYAHWGLFQSSGYGVVYLKAAITLIIILLVLIPVNELIKRLPCHKAFGV